MKNILLLICFVALANLTNAQGIEFFKGEWQAALEQARAQDKLIFVDAYAVWCGPCKRMSANVFPDEQVGVFYNRNFISLKIDMEAEGYDDFRRAYPVSAYPTLFYIDADGKVVSQVKGAMDVAAFISAGEKALALLEPAADYAEQYANGDRSPELVYKYVRSLIRNKESHLKVSNDYLRSQSDLNTPENLQFLLLAATDADSRIFTLMTERRADIVRLHSEDIFLSQVQTACDATAAKAIEFSTPELLTEAQAKMAAHHPAQAAKFEYTTNMRYALAHRDTKMYAAAARAYAKEVIPADAAKLNTFALQTANAFKDNPKEVLEAAEYAATEATKHGSDNYQNFYTLATIQRNMGKIKPALAAARKALTLATEQAPNAVNMIKAMIDKMEGEA